MPIPIVTPKSMRDLNASVEPNPNDKYYLPILAELATIYKPKSYLEIGVMSGRSAYVVSQYTTLSSMTLVDDFHASYAKNYSPQYVNKLLLESGYKGQIKWFKESSHKALPQMVNAGWKFDMIFVDGDHTSTGAMNDLENSWQLLYTNGVLAFHDICHVQHKYLEEVWNEFCAKQEVNSKFVEMHVVRLGSGMAWLVRV